MNIPPRIAPQLFGGHDIAVTGEKKTQNGQLFRGEGHRILVAKKSSVRTERKWAEVVATALRTRRLCRYFELGSGHSSIPISSQVIQVRITTGFGFTVQEKNTANPYRASHMGTKERKRNRSDKCNRRELLENLVQHTAAQVVFPENSTAEFDGSGEESEHPYTLLQDNLLL